MEVLRKNKDSQSLRSNVKVPQVPTSMSINGSRTDGVPQVSVAIKDHPEAECVPSADPLVSIRISPTVHYHTRELVGVTGDLTDGLRDLASG